ncbi:MAG: hypothetical protein Ct9H300mP1_00940 [Planctomycetaceae bacterium]|nr:MAG: hypothetical protein Ct9H300mP1_00940 [Planctomycetaceae bacterium]
MRVEEPRSFMTGSHPDRTYIVRPQSEGHHDQSAGHPADAPKLRPGKSFRTSLLPAARAMIANAIWLTNPRSSTAVRSRILRTSGPARKPAARYPVINGSRQREPNWPICSAGRAIKAKTSTSGARSRAP